MSGIPDSVFVADGAKIIGDVELGEDCSVWYNAVIRGDSNVVTIGERSNIQDNCVLHVDYEYKLSIGEDVTIGHGAIVHGCSVGDRVMIGMGAIVLNDAKIGDDCIIGAGALVTGGMEIPAGSMVYGSPAKVIRPLTDSEKESILKNAKHYVFHGKEYKEKGL